MSNDTEARKHKIDALMQGAIDTHIHSGPSLAPRIIDHIDLLKEAAAAGYAAVVTKDHDYSGAPHSALIKAHYGDLPTKLLSGIVINHTVGGFNPYAVEHTALMGGRIVWLPTLAAENHIAYESKAPFQHPGMAKGMRKPTAIPATRDGKVLDEVKDVLDVIATHDMVLAAGHLHVSEIWMVFEEAKRRGVKRLIVNHPEEIIDASMNDVRGLAAMGAYIEHSLCMFIDSSKFKVKGPEDLRAHIEAATPDMTVMSTDLGQVKNTPVIEGFRQGIAMCLDLGYGDDDIRKMFSTNAAKLFGIEVPAKH
jgi:hypothetical protein